MMIAHLTFRGMPLNQGMALAQMIRLHGLQHGEVHCLLEAMMELPAPVAQEKLVLGRYIFQNTGDVVAHFIIQSLSRKRAVEEIALFIRIIAWILTDKLTQQPASVILVNAIQRVLPDCRVCLKQLRFQ